MSMVRLGFAITYYLIPQLPNYFGLSRCTVFAA